MRALLLLFSCLALLTFSFAKPRPVVSPTIAPSRAPENWAMAPWAPKVPLALSPRHSGKAGNNFHKKKTHAGAASHYFPPKENCERITCSDPLTRTPIGSPCGCVHPIKVVIDVGVEPILLFPEIAELEIEVAAGTFLKQSQVRIMGADASIYSQERTTVSIYLVPLGERFDEMTAMLIYDRFWQKKVRISASTFGDYEVIFVHYPGLPSSPPPGNWGSLNVGPSGSREYPLTAHVPAGKKQNMDDRIIVLVSLSSFLLIFVCVGVAFIILKLKKSEQQPIATSSAVAPFTKRTGPKPIIQSSVASSASMSYVSTRAAYPSSVKTFLLTDLMKATNGFSSERLLGEGGFGRVYLGIMEHGEEVAIKLLTLEEHNFDSEFIREVEMLCRMHHRNLVKLIGICIEGRKRCLAYELVRNGSVESHLHGADKDKHKLSWEIRMKIALGAARGLSYLHEDSDPRVIHRDFKASNVLLEEDFTPKVSDFGLAKEASDASHHISTRVMGTFGYVAPEYALTGHLLVKSDVYSYGVVLLELLTGRKPVRISDSGEPENLVTLARPLLTSKEGLEQLIDPSILGTCDFDEFVGVGAVASMCVHPEASRRPFMGEVVQALKLIQGEVSSRRDECSSSSFRDCNCKGEELGMESVWWSAGSPDRIGHRAASSSIESARSRDYCTRSESRGIERKKKKKSKKKNSALLGLRNAMSEPFGC